MIQFRTRFSYASRIKINTRIFYIFFWRIYNPYVSGLSKEFDELNTAGTKNTTLRGSLPANREYNRYNNVLPCKYILRIIRVRVRQTDTEIKETALQAEQDSERERERERERPDTAERKRDKDRDRETKNCVSNHVPNHSCHVFVKTITIYKKKPEPWSLRTS